jgi:hypothetical protein
MGFSFFQVGRFAEDGRGQRRRSSRTARVGHEPQRNSSVLNELFWHARTCAARRWQSMIVDLAAFSVVNEN